MSAALGDLLDGESTHDGTRLVSDDVAIGVGVLVAALREQPALLLLPAHPPQRPLAAQLLPLEHEARVAVLEACRHVRCIARVAVLAAVPDDHRAGAVPRAD